MAPPPFRVLPCDQLCLVAQYVDIYIFHQSLMSKLVAALLIACILVPSSAMKESEVDKNDWAFRQLGEVTDLIFAKFNHPSSNLVFFESQLGIFGHLYRKNGSIASRVALRPSESIIESTQDYIIIWTTPRQIVRYRKATMVRTVDNRLMKINGGDSVHSYVMSKDIDYLYAADSRTIWKFESSTRNPTPIFTHEVPANLKCLKIVLIDSLVFALLFEDSTNMICISQLIDRKLVQRYCYLPAGQSDNNRLQYFKLASPQRMYYGWGNHSYVINLKLANITAIKLEVQPTQYLAGGQGMTDSLSSLTAGFKVPTSSSESVLAKIELNSLQLYEDLNDDRMKGSKIAQIDLNKGLLRESIKRLWVYKDKLKYEIYVQFSNLQLVCYESRAMPNAVEMWHREESLAYVNQVLFMKYEGYTDHLNNAYHMSVDSAHYRSLSLWDRLSLVPEHFLLRMRGEFEDFVCFSLHKIGLIKQLIQPGKLRSVLVDVLNLQSSRFSEMDQQEQKKYGLRKYIIAVTNKEVMMALDSKTARILWKQLVIQCRNKISQKRLVSLIKLKSDYEKEVAVMVTYASGLTLIEQIAEDGTVTLLSRHNTPTQPVVHKVSAHEILIRSGLNLQKFNINQDLTATSLVYHYYEIQEDGHSLLGWKVHNSKLEQTWKIKLPASETVINSKSAFRGSSESKVPVANPKRVFFKNVDFSNFAVLTREDPKNGNTHHASKLHLYLVNGMTGTIQLSEYRTNVNFNQPINLAYDENNAIVSYYSILNRVYEIWSVEAYQLPQEHELLTKTYAPFVQQEDIHYRSKVFGTILPIKNLHISESKQALLKRNLIIITQDSKIYLLGREFISSRRPKSDQPDDASFEDEFLSNRHPVDNYMLPINPSNYLSHHLSLVDLSRARFSSSDLQSTVFIFLNGVDSFLIRLAPDRTFDSLASSFNYLQIIGVLFFATVAAMFFKWKQQQAKLRRNYMQ